MFRTADLNKIAIGGLLLLTTIVLTSTVVRDTATVSGDSWSLRADFVAPAGGYACAVTDGAVSCWGLSDFGLGDGSTLQSDTPVDVVGLNGDVSSLASGEFHTCASTSPTGNAYCWGWGQRLGDGVNENSAAPVRVSGLSDVVGLAAGTFHSCAVTASGSVHCWGRDTFGELGDGNDVFSPVPVDVINLTEGVVAVTAGRSHTCALTAQGGVQCWGYNFEGQLGDGTVTNRREPTDVDGLASGVAAIAAGGNTTCALLELGSLKCWGTNEYGLLGDGTTTSSTVPLDVVALAADVQSIAIGANHTCASMTSGTLRCWGLNSHGQLGDGTLVDRSVPVAVAGLGGVARTISASGDRTCATTTADTVLCWGYLTDGADVPNAVPTAVPLAAKPTPIPTQFATPTPTPAPAAANGDVDCSGAVNSIDAALLLQFTAALLGALPCRAAADVSGDGLANSLDAALILQFIAGLVGELPR